MRWLLAFTLLSPLTLQAETWSLEALMAQFAGVGQRSANYREEQYLSMLEVPLESHGTLTFRAPDFIEKTVANGGGSYRVVGNRLELEQGGQLRSIPLDTTPALAAFVASFRATLAGDLEKLQQFYDTRLEGNRRSWRLTLKPLQQEMATVIREIRISGSGDRISEIDTREQGGDYTLMQLDGSNGE